jgi:sugar phosphate isomerase/epimerase
LYWAWKPDKKLRQSWCQLLKKLKRPNVGVNFDPANMILYGKGDPIEALKVLGSWIRQVHLKDATQTKAPGTWAWRCQPLRAKWIGEPSLSPLGD